MQICIYKLKGLSNHIIHPHCSDNAIPFSFVANFTPPACCRLLAFTPISPRFSKFLLIAFVICTKAVSIFDPTSLFIDMYISNNNQFS